MLYTMIVDKLRARYNTRHMKLSLHSEVDSLNLDEFMARHQIQYKKEYLCPMVKCFNNIAPKLVDGFHTE